MSLCITVLQLMLFAYSGFLVITVIVLLMGRLILCCHCPMAVFFWYLYKNVICRVRLSLYTSVLYVHFVTIVKVLSFQEVDQKRKMVIKIEFTPGLSHSPDRKIVPFKKGYKNVI